MKEMAKLYTKYGSVAPHMADRMLSTIHVSNAESIDVDINTNDLVEKCISLSFGLIAIKNNMIDVNSNKCKPLTTAISRGDVIIIHINNVNMLCIILLFINA